MARQANNQLVNHPAPQAGGMSAFDDRGQKFTTFINTNAVKNLLSQSLGGPQAAAQLTSTLISQVSANDRLKQCQPMTILSAALRGEIGMGLSLTLGDYAIVPYKDTASFQLQVNGLKRLCLNSKAYRNIGCYEVREGEFKGRDPVTRAPVIQWIEDDEEREQLPIVGYYAFYVLNDSYNGFTNSIYWTHDTILRHADRYSKAFSLATYKSLLAGKITGWDAQKLRNGSPWYDEPTALPHMKMCMKTMLKQLLGDGFAPKSTALTAAVTDDDAQERDSEAVVYADEYAVMAREAVLAAQRESPVLEAASIPAPVEKPVAAPEAPVEPPVEAKKRGRPAKQTAAEAPAAPRTAPEQAPPPAQGPVNMMEDFPPEDYEGCPEDPFGDYGYDERD